MEWEQRLAGDPRLACAAWAWLPSEASTRRYARLQAPARGGNSAVLMTFPAGTAPAEVARVERAGRLLQAAGLPVPDTYASDPEAGWILQEDLGDLDLAGLLVRDPAAAEAAYAEALGLLPRLARARLDTSPRPPLDASRLLAELQLFARRALGAEPEGVLDAELRALVSAASATPRQLCHRDYHARNLMVHGGRVRLVDHQDAMPGPAAYDRVSLAYDPYVDLTDARRAALAGDEARTGAVALQRLCKALGTYCNLGGRWRRHVTRAARLGLGLLHREGLALPAVEDGLLALAAHDPAPDAAPEPAA